MRRWLFAVLFSDAGVPNYDSGGSPIPKMDQEFALTVTGLQNRKLLQRKSADSGSEKSSNQTSISLKYHRIRASG
jgi:hypothetical protein